MNPMDYTTEQAAAIVKAAGLLAIQRAGHVFELGIVDPMTLAKGLGDEKASASFIDYAIRSDEGLGWGGACAPDGYRWNGDDFEWCGAFVAYCMPYIALDLRQLYWSSTDRLNAYAQRKLLFGTTREKALAVKYVYPAVAGAAKARLDRKFLTLNERSVGDNFPSTFSPQAGDIALFGPAGAQANFRSFGQHVTVLKELIPEAFGDRAGLHTYEGNARGEIPGRPATKAHPVQGVIHPVRPVGLAASDSRSTYHCRRLIRPSFLDIDLELFTKYGGVLPV